MPIRTRSGSSPIRRSTGIDGSSFLATSNRRSNESRLRRGSLGTVEAIKERARRGTTTSSAISSENEGDETTSNTMQADLTRDLSGRRTPMSKVPDTARQNTKESTDLEDEDSDDESDGTSLSSEIAEADDTPSMLDAVTNPLTSSPLSNIQGPTVPQNISPKKLRAVPNFLQALPPSRPISALQPVSALSLALQAKRSTAVSPFERFATLSGKGDPNPINLKIYAPFSKESTEPYEVAIRRFIREETSLERKATVVDAIGLSLWRYDEENKTPPVAGEKMNVNRWMLRMVEDGEVDYDFPSLDRTKAMDDFAFNNNNRATRTRSNSKVYDEFALVEATEEQFRDNERLTPNPTAKSTAAPQEEGDLTPQPSPGPAPLERRNPVLGHDFGKPGNRNNSITPADLPAAPVSHATPRKGPSKIVKIHFTSAEGYPQLVALDVTTDTYLAEVFDTVCKRRNLDKAHHFLKVSNTNVVAPPDRTIESLGDREDLDLVRRRFGGNDGGVGVTITGSPLSTPPPNAPLLMTEPRTANNNATTIKGGYNRKGLSTNTALQMLHPLSQQVSSQIPDSSSLLLAPSTTNYRRYTVWRKQPMSFMSTHERILAIDGEYVQIMPSETSKSSTIFFDTAAARMMRTPPTMIHFSSIVGCKCSRKHPSYFRIVILSKAKETKRYDFEAQSPEEATEIVDEIKKGVELFQNVTF